ncbi:MAG TPA: hypothetical protein VLR88_01325, partial [Propionibacteriaceae bacterium]|nr:hypothetical protein [Propionibacteriaceae bacterium]
MVGTLVKLQLKLYVRGVRGSAGRIVALIIAGVAIAAVVLAGCIGLALLRGASDDVRGGVGVLAFSSMALVWPMLALIASGADQTLDPGRFALFPVRARDIQPGLLAVGLIGVGGLTSIALALAYAYAWTTSLIPALVAVAGGALGVVSVVVTSRALTALFAKGLATRRYQDFAASILALLVIAASVGLQFVSKWVGSD